MKTAMARNGIEAYNKGFVKAYYRVSGLEKLQTQLSQDKTISAELRDELAGMIERRIGTLVESRLACVE
jgi:hypothetical protein